MQILCHNRSRGVSSDLPCGFELPVSDYRQTIRATAAPADLPRGCGASAFALLVYAAGPNESGGIAVERTSAARRGQGRQRSRRRRRARILRGLGYLVGLLMLAALILGGLAWRSCGAAATESQLALHRRSPQYRAGRFANRLPTTQAGFLRSCDAGSAVQRTANPTSRSRWSLAVLPTFPIRQKVVCA